MPLVYSKDDESLDIFLKTYLRGEDIFGAGPEHKLLVNLHFALGPLSLQLAGTLDGAGVRVLQ